jgi:hypothetical protein
VLLLLLLYALVHRKLRPKYAKQSPEPPALWPAAASLCKPQQQLPYNPRQVTSAITSTLLQQLHPQPQHSSQHIATAPHSP